jgi:hypothetical protein
MQKLLLIISLIAWCGFQHFDLIRKTCGITNIQPDPKSYNFEMSAFNDFPKLNIPKARVFIMRPIRVEKKMPPLDHEKHERKKGGVRITKGSGEELIFPSFNMLKS